MRQIVIEGNRLVVKSDPPAKKLTVEERLASLEAENVILKTKVATIEKASKVTNPA